MPPAPTKHLPRPSPQLTAAAKAGIIAASIAFFVILLLFVLEYIYLRRKRRDRDLERAIDEVEDGTELKESTASESKENMVLESRVEIVIEEEQRSESESWDGDSQWGDGTDGEDSDGDLGEWGRRGRWERLRSRCTGRGERNFVAPKTNIGNSPVMHMCGSIPAVAL